MDHIDDRGYGTAARLLHWVMAVLILLTLPAGLIMVRDGIGRGLQDALFIYHKNVGVLLLVLCALRLLLRWRNPPPPRAVALPPWQEWTAMATHRMLYGLVLVVAVAGYVRVRAGGFPIEAIDALGMAPLLPRSDALAEAAKALHYAGGLVIMAVISLHIAAAAFHAIVRRDGVIRRMWPPLGGRHR